MRRTVAAAAALLAVVLAVDSLTPPRVAAQTGGGSLGPGYVRATASDLGAGTFPGSGIPAVTPSSTSPYTWSRASTGAFCVVFPGPVPPALAAAVSPLPGILTFPNVPVHVGALLGAPPGALRMESRTLVPPGATVVGDLVVDVATPVVPGPDLEVSPRCASAGEPLPPDPPAAADVWQQTPLPRATIHADPPGTRAWPGITGMESRFHVDPLADARAAVSLDGYDVTVIARPVSFAWEIGTTAALGPGTRARFAHRGDVAVMLYVVWAGVAHVTAPAWGLDFGLEDLGTVTIPERIVYHVAEIRAVLRSPRVRP